MVLRAVCKGEAGDEEEEVREDQEEGVLTLSLVKASRP